jgi:DNA recombination protein RmuC
MLQGMLEEFLHPSQFERNFKPKPRSSESVEFAIKLPNRDQNGDGDPVWMPIDAKFPKESYERLVACMEAGDLAGAEANRKLLLVAVTSFARDIRDKYVSPPRTTDFAILYLPLESLFAEVVREPGFIERLQADFRVTILSPTTLAAYLNALQMGFRTLAVQKQSAEISKLLAVVRKQFQMFGSDLSKVEKRLEESRNALAATVKRTQIMDTKLKSIDVASEQAVGEVFPANGLPDLTDEASAEDGDSDSDGPRLGIAG